MLACDLILEVRASRLLSRMQVARLEREVLAGIDRHGLDLLFLLDRYAERADPTWPPLLARAAAAAGSTLPDTQQSVSLPAAA